jgi:hypothetical protein
VGLERGPLSLVSTTEELLGRNNSGFGLENQEYGRGDPLRWPRDTLYPQKLALTSSTSGGRLFGIVRLRTTETEGFFTLITVAARSKAWTVFVRSNTGIVGSNPTQGTDVYVRLFSVCVVPCVGSGLATGWSSKETYRPCID